MQHHPQKKGLTLRLEHPQQYSYYVCPCPLQLDEEKSKHTGLAQQNALTEHFCKVS
jgi:hypothetical protein